MPCLPGKLHNFYLCYHTGNREYDLRVLNILIYTLLARFYEKKIPKKFDPNKRAKNINYTISYRKSICLITQFLVPIKPVYVNSDTAPFAI